MKAKLLLFILLCFAPALFAQHTAARVIDSNAIKTLFFSGLRDKLKEDYSQASESFNKILAFDPNNAAVHYEIAVVNYRQNNLYEAEVAIKKATALDTENIWYWMMTAELLKRKGDMNGMAGVLSQLIRISPEKIAFYFDRSNAYLLAGNVAEAMKGYDDIEREFGLSDELAQARSRVNFDARKKYDAKGAAVNESKVPLTEATDTELKMLRAESLYKKGDLNGALIQFKLVLEGDEHPYKAWEQTLNIQLLLKQYKGAIKTADEALSIYPNQAILYYFMAMALHQDDQNDLALKHIKSALNLDAENGIYLELYGDILFLKGDVAVALQQWKKARAAGNGSKKLNKKINERNYFE